MSSFKLRQELLNDPSSRGYSGMTDTAVLTDLGVKFRPIPDKDTITNNELYNLIDDGEFALLSAADKSRLRDLYLIENIDISAGAKARANLIDIFKGAGGAQTRAAVTGFITNRLQSTAEFLGLRSSLLRETAIAGARIPDQPDGPPI